MAVERISLIAISLDAVLTVVSGVIGLPVQCGRGLLMPPLNSLTRRMRLTIKI
jgi:hypothetical protein